MREDCTKTLAYLKQSIVERFDVNLSLNTIFRALGCINFTLKQITLVPHQRNTEERISERARYAEEFDRIQASYLRSQIIFVNEAGFNLSMRRSRGWSRVNTEARVTVPFTRSYKISVCAAINANGPIMYEVNASAYNSGSFKEFMINLSKTYL